MNVSLSSITVFSALYFMFITKYWYGFQIFGLVLNALVVVLVPLLPESPKYLLSKRKYDQARLAILKIAKFQRLPNNQLQMVSKLKFEEEFLAELSQKDFSSLTEAQKERVLIANQESKDKQLDGSLKDLVRIRKHLINLILMIWMWVASSFSFYLISFQIKYIKGDVFVNTIVSASTEILGFLVSGLIYQSLGGIRNTFALSYIIAIIGGILLMSF